MLEALSREERAATLPLLTRAGRMFRRRALY
jgi:hypothetical protein